MTQENARIRDVIKHYGPRDTGGAHGQYKSIGPLKTLSFKLNLDFLTDADNDADGLNAFLASGVTVTSARAIVHQPFSASTAITFTASNGQGTIPVLAGDLDAVGVTTLVPTGNLAIGSITDDVGVFSIGAANVVPGTAEGEAEIFIEYIQTELP
jgi:hypothetical protein